MNTSDILSNRIKELAERAYSENRYLFTDFLDMSQLSVFYALERELRYVGTAVSGGMPVSSGVDGNDSAGGLGDRCMVRFGSPEVCGYEEDFPIDVLHISPVQKKFSDTLTHRDFLGSVIGLGIERTKLGDILVRDNEAYMFVSNTISDYIIETLNKVKHTNVTVERCTELPAELAPKFSEESVVVSSNRLDAIIARTYNMSRELAARFITEGKVFVCGREIISTTKSLKEGDVVSVRGKGKFIFDGEEGVTRKSKLYVKIKRYV
ncbi:MAG: hypothetical protein J5517_04370 [Eubacterium sp.]|nr:hypothetical protein [Eubacterium sp.]